MGEYGREQRNQLSRAIANSEPRSGQLKGFVDNRQKKTIITPACYPMAFGPYNASPFQTAQRTVDGESTIAGAIQNIPDFSQIQKETYQYYELEKFVNSTEYYNHTYVISQLGKIDEFKTFMPNIVDKPVEIQITDALLNSNMIFEECIGTELLQNVKTKNTAIQIHTKAEDYVKEFNDAAIKSKAETGIVGNRPIDTWGGAWDFAHGNKTVNGEVYAISQYFAPVIEKEGLKDNFPRDNVLAMKKTGNFVFDKKIHEVPPSEWPEHIKKIVKSAFLGRYSNLKEDFIDESFSALLNVKWEKKKLEAFLYNDLDLKFSCNTNLIGETPFQEEPSQNGDDDQSNPLGPEYRQHHAGKQFNVITFTPYIHYARSLMKPILSGPSGTAFRFVNVWAFMKKELKAETPSMNDALLLIMANLLPPNEHHSYHEIMDGVNGVDNLKYQDKEGYQDLNIIDSDTYTAADASFRHKTKEGAIHSA